MVAVTPIASRWERRELRLIWRPCFRTCSPDSNIDPNSCYRRCDVALKDLIVSHAELTEEQIENFVSPYARYDLVAISIVLLLNAMSLSIRQRVIVYLVALRGWPFVVSEDAPPTSATPAELERSLQIPGGT